MNLSAIKYLFHLILEGEKTSKEIAKESGGSIYSISHAMGALHSLNLVKHPESAGGIFLTVMLIRKLTFMYIQKTAFCNYEFFYKTMAYS